MVTWPLYQNQIRSGSISNTFGDDVRKYADGRKKPHQGWDFSANIGTTVYAIGAGKIVFCHNHGDYGLQLCHSFIHNGRTLYAFYAHLQAVLVSSGEVKMDDEIALTGNSGNAHSLPSDQNHLHFEIREHPHCGLGIAGRMSPIRVFGICPLNGVIFGGQTII